MPDQSPHLIIHQKVWHYRLFRWSLGIIDAWRSSQGCYEGRFEYGTTLPHYLRVILIYTPLVILSHVALGVWLLYGFLIIPVEIGGIWEYLTYWVLLFLLGLFLLFLRVLLQWWATLRAPIWNEIFAGLGWTRYRPFKREKYAPGTMAVVKHYIRSRWSKILPLITFVKEPE